MSRSVLLIRADASPKIGTGHVMRMIALAQAWRRRGGEAHLLSWNLPPALRVRLAAESIHFHVYSPTTWISDATFEPTALYDSEEHARFTCELAKRLHSEWIVADGYHYTARFQQVVAETGLRLAIVTDYDYCENWFCKILVNQNPHADREKYASPDAEMERLLGTRYALLRNEFLDSEKSPAAEVANGSASTTHASARRKKILVTLGGSDPTNVTTKLLLQLERLSSPIAIRVLIGAANPNHASLLKLAMQSQHQIDVRCSVSDMPEQFRWADAIVSAGGSSCWEWMYYGLDAGIVAIAENQLPIYDELVGKRSAIGLARLDEPIHIQSLQRFIDSVDINNHSPKRYRKWIDGYGADRIAAALDTTTWLRCTTQDDMRLYFDWANDPSVRQNSLQTKEIRWEEHCEWFTSQLNRDDRKLLVAIRQEAPIGQIRFSKTSTGMWDVAFSVAAEARGQGTGQEIIRLGTAWMRSKGLFGFTATVKRDNIPSARCFEKLNWRFIENSDKELLCFQLP